MPWREPECVAMSGCPLLVWSVLAILGWAALNVDAGREVVCGAFLAGRNRCGGAQLSIFPGRNDKKQANAA